MTTTNKNGGCQFLNDHDYHAVEPERDEEEHENQHQYRSFVHDGKSYESSSFSSAAPSSFLRRKPTSTTFDPMLAQSINVNTSYMGGTAFSAKRGEHHHSTKKKEGVDGDSKCISKNISKLKKARKNIGSYRRTKRGGDFYDTWKGRISVHTKVKYFDLKLLVKNVLEKTDLFVEKGWEIMEFYDVIRLSLPSSPPPTTDCTALGPRDVTASPPVDTFVTIPPAPSPTPALGTAQPVDLLDAPLILDDEEEQLISPTAYPQQEEDQEERKQHEPISNHEEIGEGASTPEIYIFSFGAVVFWNFQTEENEEAWMNKYIFAFGYEQEKYDDDDYDIKDVDYAIGGFNPMNAIESANDEISFAYGSTFQVKRDVVNLKTREHGEKMALSFALAKSAMLSIFEWRLDQVIERNSYIPEQLAKYGRIAMSSKEISREIGKIYLVKCGINLENNVLDTPEEFWEGK